MVHSCAQKQASPSVAAAALFCLPRADSAIDFSGTAETRFALAKLNVLGSILMIGAHPDDENNALVAYCSRGLKTRFGYLSLNRGEGGQNLLGPELGEGLGVIRTQELLAARRIDGGAQYFTRAIDFGFTLSAPETLEKWGRERILGDIVWVIRNQRPDIILLCFSGTPADGHGQHQVSGILGKEAYTAAADTKRFPEQLKYVKPWAASRLMRSSFRDAAEASKGKVTIDTGDYDPLFGRSYRELGTLSRGEHKSQGQASKLAFGSAPGAVNLLDGKPVGGTMLDGIDTSWSRVPGGAPVGALLAKARDTFEDLHPEKTVPVLLEARGMLAGIAAKGDAWAQWKLRELDDAIGLCAGLRLEAESDRGVVSAGGKLKVSLTALNRSKLPVKLRSIHLTAAWTNQDVKPKDGDLAFNKMSTTAVDLVAGQAYSQPFWLAAKHNADVYEIADQALIGRADILPELVARFDVEVAGTAMSFERPLQYRYADPARTEFVRPVAIEPPIAVELPSRNLVVPAGSPGRANVEIHSLFGAAKGTARLQVPAGWKVTPASLPFEMKEAGEVQELSFRLDAPAAAQSGQWKAIAQLSTGQEVSVGLQLVDYAHIPTQTILHPAEGSLSAVPLRLLSKRVGYIMGTSDDEPQAIRQMGAAVELLGEKELTSANLNDFDAIVTGVRAPAVRPDLRANQQRLFEYVKNGGTLIVQYNKNSDRRMSSAVNEAMNHLGPYPFTFGDNEFRVTQEDAPVRLLDAKSTLFHMPNEITQADFDGWVQERGLYFADKWDSHYSTVLESHDKGKKDLPGGMLYARYGKGVYIFTAYAWFRQLPAGVPGAYRLFANMISAGKALGPQ